VSGSSLSDYEDWVRALRSWRRDATADLESLPALEASSFPPATYRRFLKHLNDAINEFMKRWQTQLSAALSAAVDDHARARALVEARVGLAHRLRLARHPSFPQEIRDQLEKQAIDDVTSIQAQLEEDARSVVSASSSSSRPAREATLRLIRDNALTAVLDPGYALDSSVEGVDAGCVASAEEPVVPPDDFLPRRPRRVLFDASGQE